MQAAEASTQTAFDLFRESVEKRNGPVAINGMYHITNCPGPNHQRGDQNPSLHFWEVMTDDGRSTVWTKCQSGNCTPGQIYKGLGIAPNSIPVVHSLANLKEPVLTLFDLANYTGIDWRILYNLGWDDAGETFHKKDGTPYKLYGVKHRYYLTDGTEYERSKLRIRLEKKGKHDRWVWTEGDVPTPIAYGLNTLQKAVEQGYIIVVEGESDYATLYGGYGIPCLGIPGANQVAKTLHADQVKDIPRIYVIQEKTDQAGINFPFIVKKQLTETGYTGEILRVPLRTLTGAKDPNELHKRLFNQMHEQKSGQPFRDAFQHALDQAMQMDVDTALPEIDTKYLEGIPPAIAKAIATLDKPALIKRAAEISLLSEIERARIRVAIRNLFGADFPLREFDDLLRVERDQYRRPGPQVFKLCDLQAETFPSVKWIIPDILPEGLTWLCGKPKLGKSWMLLAMMCGIASGGVALGNIPVEQGEVLYLSLEDNKRRLKDRANKVLNNLKASPNFYYQTEWPRLNEGGLEALEGWLKDHPNARIIGIDTWAKIKPRSSGKQNRQQYDEDYDALTPLQELAGKYNVSIVIVHHMRKLESDDPLDTVAGSVALQGAVDGFLLLYRKRGEENARLFITGRDIEEEQELLLTFNKDTASWKIEGDSNEHAGTPEQEAILKVLKPHPDGLTLKQIIEKLQKNINTTRNLLVKLRNDGKVTLKNNVYCVVSIVTHSNHSQSSNHSKGQESAPEPVSEVTTQSRETGRLLSLRSNHSNLVNEPVEPVGKDAQLEVTIVTTDTIDNHSKRSNYPENADSSGLLPPTTMVTTQSDISLDKLIPVTMEDRTQFGQVCQHVGQLKLTNQPYQGVLTYGQYLNDLRKILELETVQASRLKWAQDEMGKMMTIRKV